MRFEKGPGAVAGPGRGMPGGRGMMPPVPVATAAPGLTGPVRGIGGPSPASMQPGGRGMQAPPMPYMGRGFPPPPSKSCILRHRKLIYSGRNATTRNGNATRKRNASSSRHGNAASWHDASWNATRNDAARKRNAAATRNGKRSSSGHANATRKRTTSAKTINTNKICVIIINNLIVYICFYFMKMKILISRVLEFVTV